MSSSHAPSTNYSSEKYHNHPSGVSPPFSSMTSSFSGGLRSTAAASTFPTPASSAAGTVPATVEDVDGDMMMDEGSETGSLKRRRTSSSPYDRASQTMAPALRHRGLPEGISPQIPTEQELLSQPDVSPYYLVCENARQPSYPDLTDNLLSLYDLTAIADSVARKHPTTGAKNKLRKSYKGFINDLPGKNLVVTKASQTEVEPGGRDSGGGGDYFARLLMYPEEEWRNREVIGKDLSRGIDMGKLRKGLMSMGRGEIPGFDASILGLDEERRKPSSVAIPVVGAPTATPVHANGSTPGAASPSGEEARPKRNKKRRFHDYEGYDVNDGDEDNSGVNGSGRGGGGGPGGGVAAITGGAAREVGEKRKKKRKKNLDPGMNSSANGGGAINMTHHAHTHSGGITVHGGGYGR